MHGISGIRNRPASVNGQTSSTSSVQIATSPGQASARPAQGANPSADDRPPSPPSPRGSRRARRPSNVLEDRADLDERAGDLVGDAPDVEDQLPGDPLEPGAIALERAGRPGSGPRDRPSPSRPARGRRAAPATVATARASRHRRRSAQVEQDRHRQADGDLAGQQAGGQEHAQDDRIAGPRRGGSRSAGPRRRRGSSTGPAACRAARTGSRRRSAPRAS